MHSVVATFRPLPPDPPAPLFPPSPLSMGADGGSIVGRAELVRTAKRAVSLHSVKEVAKEAANSCALSQTPLRAPVVVCAMGLLYNKDALLEYLLSKQSFPHFSHITSMKDVGAAKLQWNQKEKEASMASAGAKAGESHFASAASSSSSDASGESRSLYSCPITALPSNGTNKFVCMQPCGCVISERAFRQVGSGAGAKIESCIACGQPLAPDTPPPAIAASFAASAAGAASSSSDASAAATAAVSSYHHPSYLTLFPGPEETLYLRALMADRIKQREADKIAKKAAKKAGAAAAASAAATAANGATMGDAPVDAATTAGSHKRKLDDSDGSPAASTSASSSLTDGALGAPASSTAAAAASSSAASSSVAASSRPSKKPHLATGAHAALVSSKTGNVLSDHVRAITENAARLVAERRKESAKFDSMFLSPEQIAATRHDPISTKPASLMGQL